MLSSSLSRFTARVSSPRATRLRCRDAAQRLHGGRDRERAARQPQDNRDVFSRLGVVQQADGFACAGHLHGRAPRRRRDAVQRGLFPSTTSGDLRAASSSTYQSTSTTPAVCSKIDLICAASADRRAAIRPVDLGDERLQHRRPGRHFGHLDRGAEARARSATSRSRTRLAMSWLCALALVLRQQVHLQVGEVGAAAQEVVPHQAVEVEGDAVPGVGLDVDDLRVLVQDALAPVRRATRAVCSSACPRACRRSPGTRSCCRTAASSP